MVAPHGNGALGYLFFILLLFPLESLRGRQILLLKRSNFCRILLSEPVQGFVPFFPGQMAQPYPEIPF